MKPEPAGSSPLSRAVEAVIIGALEHLGERVQRPAGLDQTPLEVGACIRILRPGEPGTEFTAGAELAHWTPPLPCGTLVLYFLARCPYASGTAATALYIQALGCAWRDFEPGIGMSLPGGYRGWIGPLSGTWVQRVAA